MSGGTPGADGPLGKVIAEEGAKAGLSPARIAAFLAATETRSKGGSYDICPDSGPCSKPYWWVRSAAGTLWLPFKNAGGRTYDVAFVYGRFADEIVIDCTFTAMTCIDNKTAAPTAAYNAAGRELFRRP